jgi:hypothetical protein
VAFSPIFFSSDMKNLIGEANCRICQENFSTTVNGMSKLYIELQILPPSLDAILLIHSQLENAAPIISLVLILLNLMVTALETW